MTPSSDGSINSAPRLYRMLRVLEYVGTEEFIENARNNRGVKGTYTVPRFGVGRPEFRGVIREAVLGDTSELLSGFEAQAFRVRLGLILVGDPDKEVR